MIDSREENDVLFKLYFRINQVSLVSSDILLLKKKSIDLITA